MQDNGNSFIIGEMCILISISIAFISASALVNDWCQALFISIGTGLLASAIVSFAFWEIQRESEKRIACKRRSDFMEQFKILAYNIIHDINWSCGQSTLLSLNDYIKSQHRWFHEYYKKIVAENAAEDETDLRIKQMTQFIKEYTRDLQSAFDARVVWEDGNFSEWQLKELKGLYNEFCDCKDYQESKNYQSAFLSFAWFLEIFKRIMTEDSFDELKYFDLMQFSYDDVGQLTIIDDKFDEKEIMFKFAKNFNQIRHDNYKKYYGKNAEQEQSNG